MMFDLLGCYVRYKDVNCKVVGITIMNGYYEYLIEMPLGLHQVLPEEVNAVTDRLIPMTREAP